VLVERLLVAPAGVEHTSDRLVAEPTGGVDALAESRHLGAPIQLAHEPAVLDLGDQQPRGVGTDVDDSDAHGAELCHTGCNRPVHEE
jgi:hypothetical protein